MTAGSALSGSIPHLAGIVEIQVAHLRRRLADRGLSLDLTDAAKSALAEEGYDPQFGARPLKRIIQQRLVNPIATQILAGNFEPGDTIKADYQGKTFTFALTEAVEEVPRQLIEEG